MTTDPKSNPTDEQSATVDDSVDKKAEQQLTTSSDSTDTNVTNEKKDIGAKRRVADNNDIDSMIDTVLQMYDETRMSRLPLLISESSIIALLERSRAVFFNEPTLLTISAPLHVCGDIHGQFTDLLRIFLRAGFPPYCNYIFLGDYVDRGSQSLETILLLLCYKCRYPNNFFLLRGNHETAAINMAYGFYQECKRRYSSRLWLVFQDVFNCLPLAATISERLLCMHGGLSPQLTSLSQIIAIKRPLDPPDVGLAADLMWSDPDPAAEVNWEPSTRGLSYRFSKRQVLTSCQQLGIDLIVRAHQVVMDGYEFFADRHLVTIFSAPNYCGEYQNQACVMRVDEQLLCRFLTFKVIDNCAVTVRDGKDEKTGSWSSHHSMPSNLNTIRQKALEADKDKQSN